LITVLTHHPLVTILGSGVTAKGGFAEGFLGGGGFLTNLAVGVELQSHSRWHRGANAD
jgi:hypothetical protein